MSTMQPLLIGDPPVEVYIHTPCLAVETWTAAHKAEYGPISEQGCDVCDCAADGNWRRVWVEQEYRTLGKADR